MRRRDATEPEVRASALKLLSSGRVTLPEIASVLGVSTQSVWNWCREAKVDWRKARLTIVASEWRKASK